MSSRYLPTALLLIVVVRLLFLGYRAFKSPLYSIPGPFWTRFTKLWYFNRVRIGHFEHENIDLHRKYGPIVRIAPDHYSIDDPAAIKTIYGTGSKFPKSEWYEAFKNPSPDYWALFPDRNMKRHADTRKLFQGMYSMSTLVSYEPFVDHCSEIFISRLTDFAQTREVLDMGHWLQCYAFDVIGDITYSKRFGFLDRGEDVEGTMAALRKMMKYSTLIGIYAKMHPILWGVMSRCSWSGAGARAYFIKYVQGRIRQRKEENARGKDFGKNHGEQIEGAPEDFLQKMMKANQEDPSKVTNYHVFMMGLANIIAGSDTTAVSLSAILYYLLRYPETMRKLRSEIEQLAAQDQCGSTDGRITFKQSQEMPYLQAVMKEALRMCSATGLPLWREVPRGGAEISGLFFPAGTVVGVNPWCSHYNESVFQDAKQFRPERWMEAETAGSKLKEMEAYYMPVSTFRNSKISCIVCQHQSGWELTLLISTVRAWIQNMPGQTRLHSRDVEAHPATCQEV